MRLLNILKEDNIIKVSPDNHLSSGLAKLTTSHDAAFVFDENKNFLGAVNPYHCLIRSSYPGSTKIRHCLVHPPKIYLNYSLAKVINLLIQSKIHYLPVFDEQERFLGVISARRVLSYLKTLPIYQDKVERLLKNKKRPPLVIYEDETIAKAHDLFRKTKISKLIVIDREMKLKGVLSYYDLISILDLPKQKPEKGGREGNKVRIFRQKVRNFMKNYVLTLTSDKPLSSVINLILEKKIGSVIIIDRERHPTGIITTRDIFQYFLIKE